MKRTESKRLSARQRIVKAAMRLATYEANQFLEWSGTLPQRMRRSAGFFGDPNKRALIRACADLLEKR